MADLTAATESEIRAAIGKARRIVVKIGSSSLTTAEHGLDHDRMAALVGVLADAHDEGRDVILVSSGAIAAGLSPLGLARRPRDLAHQQAAAAVGQGLLAQRYTELFAARGITIAQVLLTVDDVTRMATYRNASRTLGTLLRMGVLPIVNENDTVATHEIRFGDNDRLAARVSELVRADGLVLLTDVDGLYTAHPSEPGSEHIGFVPDIIALEADTRRQGSAVGSGGMTSKLQAAEIATAAGIPVVLASADDAADAMAGRTVGTAFTPSDRPRPRRLLWMAHATTSCGSLVLDDGAVKAITTSKASLLAAGITAVEGTFVAGDPVDLVDQRGNVIARGLVGFDSCELPPMLGRKSASLARDLGDDFGREVVHRDALIVLRRR